MFDKIKQLMQLKSQMAEIKKRLDAMVIKVQSPSKYVEITISGSQEVKEVLLLQELASYSKEALEKDIKEGINKAIKESQAMAAKTMGDMAGLGGLGA